MIKGVTQILGDEIRRDAAHETVMNRLKTLAGTAQSLKMTHIANENRIVFKLFPDARRHERLLQELDTVIGRNHKGAILTVNDRATGLCWLALLDEKESEPLKNALINMLSPLKGVIKTATADNGKEFAAHREIAEALGTDVFFAHPYHSWERGANENMNGLIRQYIPKKSSFENLNDKDIQLIQNKLNNRPRKRLNFLTPIEYFVVTLNS